MEISMKEISKMIKKMDMELFKEKSKEIYFQNKQEIKRKTKDLAKELYGWKMVPDTMATGSRMLCTVKAE